MRNIGILTFVLILLGTGSCDPAKKAWNNFNLFPVEDDVELGKQVSDQIASDKENFPILAERGNEEVYRYIRSMTNEILNSGKVEHRDKFAWKIHVIDDDETLNAFVTPGGYIYVYTGLILFLDHADDLAGVMGHEIAHAAYRHSTAQMTKLYGLDLIRAVITGQQDAGLIGQIALSLSSLSFSRFHESQADAASVKYLCDTIQLELPPSLRKFRINRSRRSF
jgi:predicted Zn-dependent protease